MKKKRTPLIILSLVAAFSILTVTAFANVPEYAGYEAFKDLANNKSEDFKGEENATVSGTLEVIDNDESLFSMEAVMKSEGEDENGSGSVTLTSNGTTKSMDFYGLDEKVYLYDQTEDTYYVADKSELDDEDYEDYESYHGNRDGKDFDGEMTAAQEELLDFVVGDLKDDFDVIYNSDKSQTITFELTKDEIPMLLNLVVSASDGEKFSHDQMDETMIDATLLEKYPILNDFMDMKTDVPELSDNIELEYARAALTTEANGDFRSIEFSVIATGDDEDGLSHKIEANGTFEVSNVGTTVIDTLDVEGKEMIEIDAQDFEDFHDDEDYHGRGQKGQKGRR